MRYGTLQRRKSHFIVCLIAGVALLATAPTPGLAVPKQTKSCDATGKDKGMNACADSPGHIIVCTSGGDYLCCKVTPTGKDCEEIVKDSEASVTGKFKGGQLQRSPTTSIPKASPLQKGNMNAPIMRRGVDGESSTSSPTVPAEAGK